MTNNNKLAEFAGRFWPGTHRRYREICVLATTGQLGGPEMSELDAHVAHCESCRKYLESIAQASVQAMSMLAAPRIPAPDEAPPEGMRARFLSRAAAAGLRVEYDTAVRCHPVPVPNPLPVSPSEQNREVVDSIRRKPSSSRIEMFPFLGRAAVVSALCITIWIAGYLGGRRRALHEDQPPIMQPPASIVPVPTVNPATGDSNRISELEQRKTALEAQTRDFEDKLSQATAEKKALTDRLSGFLEKLTEINRQARDEQARASQEKQDAKNQIAFLQAEVEKLRWQLDASDAKVAAQQKQGDELKTKLERTEAELQHEADLKSARLEIGDLVAARNLHIIDVYDGDNKGARQHSFGRVFYIEGQSLVFYVYDLEDPRRLNANVVFRVWGEKSGMKETTHNLGILHNEEASQDRWSLRFDDPKVLAQINSVFVTVEPANKHYDEPHGRKVLYAFFGSPPNHP
jgi:hypothetical protein